MFTRVQFEPVCEAAVVLKYAYSQAQFRLRQELARRAGIYLTMKQGKLISGAESKEASERLRRIRSLAWLLDDSIPLPGGFRIGLDPLIGLVPGLGDAVGALISAYVINEARILGAPNSLLLRMSGNVMLDTVIGAIPFAGDLFDAGFKANSRNLALLAKYQLDPVSTRRRSRWFVFGFSILLALLVLAMIAIPVLLIVALVRAF